jgi:hypothetical protein
MNRIIEAANAYWARTECVIMQAVLDSFYHDRDIPVIQVPPPPWARDQTYL